VSGPIGTPAMSISMQTRGLPLDLVAEQERLLRRMLHLPGALELACATKVGTTPADVVLARGSFKLLRYRRATPATHAEPVLFCYALINRPYILDLLPDKSIVRRYLEQGFDVYMIDWGVPSDADRVFTLESYVCGFLSDAVAYILRQHRREDLHLLGYCMGGTMSVLYATLEPARIKTLTLLAAPLDFSGRDALLHLWTDPSRFDVDGFIDSHGNCPGWFLQSCFLFMKPIQNLVEKNISIYEQLDDPRAVSSYWAMERWTNDNIPVAGETFREFVKKLYQRNELVRGELHLGPRRIDLGRITCPLMLLTARNDHLVAPASTEGIRPYVRSTDVTSMVMEAGHVGLVVGGKAQKTMWPEATRWLAARSTPTA
jgi:polyhydroxyalkanoate synthase subunit PhaC